MKRVNVFAAVITSIACALAGLMPQSAAAHGAGVPRLTEAPAGPYFLTVWISPAEIAADETVHVTIAVHGDDEPVLDAEVSVEFRKVEIDTIVASAQATTDQSANKLLYEADTVVMEPGVYDVKIIVIGSEGRGEAVFNIDVQAGSRTNWALILAPLSLGLIVAAAWIQRTRRRTTAQIKRR